MRRIIISLMLITVMIIGTGLAYASIQSFGTDNGQSIGSWSQTNGILGVSGGAIISDPSAKTIIGRDIGAVNANKSGKFDITYTFKVVNLSSDVFVGVSDGLLDTNDLLIGYSKDNNAFIVTQNQQNVLSTLGTSVNPGSTYTAKIHSDDGKNFACSIDGVGSYTYTSGFVPTYAAVVIFNNGVDNGPQVNSLTFTTPTATGTATPTPGTNSTATSAGVDYAAMQNWYATQYVPPVLSNQSVVYDQGGNIVKVITGKPGAATVMPISGATTTISATTIPTVVPASNVTAPLNVTKNTTPTIKPVTTAAPTKSQSPGFGIILVAIGMLGAMFLISRKK